MCWTRWLRDRKARLLDVLAPGLLSNEVVWTCKNVCGLALCLSKCHAVTWEDRLAAATLAEAGKADVRRDATVPSTSYKRPTQRPAPSCSFLGRELSSAVF